MHALHELDLHVEAGEVYCLLGPNGAGKSTTMNEVAPGHLDALLERVELPAAVGRRRCATYSKGMRQKVGLAIAADDPFTWAQNFYRVQRQWAVETDRGVLHARRLIVAVGLGEQPHWPRWASALRQAGGRVAHIFSPGFERPQPTGPIVVVGGGISAVQVALACSEMNPGRVTLVARHAARVAQFDSDPGWLGPLYLNGFARERRLPAADHGLHARHRPGAVDHPRPADLRRMWRPHPPAGPPLTRPPRPRASAPSPDETPRRFVRPPKRSRQRA